MSHNVTSGPIIANVCCCLLIPHIWRLALRFGVISFSASFCASKPTSLDLVSARLLSSPPPTLLNGDTNPPDQLRDVFLFLVAMSIIYLAGKSVFSYLSSCLHPPPPSPDRYLSTWDKFRY